MINNIILLVKISISLGLGVFLAYLGSCRPIHKARNLYLQLKTKNEAYYSQTQERRIVYDALEEKLMSQGIKYRFGNQFTCFDYMVLRLAAGFIAAILFAGLQLWLMPAGFALAYWAIPFYFKEQDMNDNDAMLQEISQMNRIVALQVKNGVFISKVIYECYRQSSHGRLKQALLELAIDMERFSSVEQAALQFRKKFNNMHIEQFSKTIEQMVDTGKSEEFYKDIQSSILRINESIAIKEEQRAESQANVYSVMLFIGPMLLVFYMLFLYMGQIQKIW